MLDSLKQSLVRTPLERPLLALRGAWKRLDRRSIRELPELAAEGGHIDRWLRAILRPDSHCIDVGCHIGGTLSLLLRLAPRGRHVAFEPVPEKARRLRRKFPEVEVHQLALSDRTGTVEFFVNQSRPGFSGLKPHGGRRDEIRPIAVGLRRLDDVVEPGRPCRFLKIDVEGAERDVLRGAAGLLRADRPFVLFECTASGLRSHGVDASDVFGFLTEDVGFEVLLPGDALDDGPTLTFDSFRRALDYPFRAFNFIARPSGTRR